MLHSSHASVDQWSSSEESQLLLPQPVAITIAPSRIPATHARNAAKAGRQERQGDVGVGGPDGHLCKRAAEDGNGKLALDIPTSSGTDAAGTTSSSGAGTGDDERWRTSMRRSSTGSRRGSRPGWTPRERERESDAPCDGLWGGTAWLTFA